MMYGNARSGKSRDYLRRERQRVDVLCGELSGSRAYARVAWVPPLRGSDYLCHVPRAYALG